MPKTISELYYRFIEPLCFCRFSPTVWAIKHWLKAMISKVFFP